MTIHNCVFLSFFYAETDIGLEFLELTLRWLFDTLFDIDHIAYLLPDSLILFPPLSSQRLPPAQKAAAAPSVNSPKKQSIHDAKRKARNLRTTTKFFAEKQLINQSAPYSLQMCSRREFMPLFVVRPASIEDCDDLIPIFKENNLLNTEHADFFMAKLVEADSGRIKTLVSEVDGKVVGFMSIRLDVDQNVLYDDYELELFDFLVKDVPYVDALASGNDLTAKSLTNGLNESKSKVIRQDDAPTHVQNSFCINLFCIDPAWASYSIEFVRTAFELIPHRDYCVMTLPHNLPEPMLLERFSRINSKPGKISSHNLYLANRFGISDFIRVRRCNADDLDNVSWITSGLSNKDDIDSALKAKFTDNSDQYDVFVPIFMDQICGVFVIESCKDPQQLTDQFEIEKFVSTKLNPLKDKYVLLRHAILNPLFECQFRWSLQEIMRTLRTQCLIYVVDNICKRDLATKRLAIHHFVPVKRRRMIQFPNNVRDNTKVPDPLPFNVQIITNTLIPNPRTVVNHRVVVLGGSDVGVSFLEQLIYKPHLNFTNLTLICKNGVPSVEPESQFVSHRCFSSLELKQIALDYYVDIIQDTTDKLDREKKTIVVSSGDVVRYEYLILTPGVQFHIGDLDPLLARLDHVHSVIKYNVKKIERNVKSLIEQVDSVAVV